MKACCGQEIYVRFDADVGWMTEVGVLVNDRMLKEDEESTYMHAE